LSDGEDFELLLCLSPEDAHRLRLMTWPFDVQRTCVGQIVDRPGLWQRVGGKLEAVPPRGYLHGG
jgi:thiamine-monophosphate kinase